MDGSMIGLVTPLFKPFVQGGKREGGGKKGDKLHTEGFEISLDFSFSFRAIRGAVNEGDAKRGGGVGELMRPEGRPIVDVNFSG